ncbi:MAG: glycosyltransferase [Lachnospiraceae bacterium]|nr:glycosyltransferase [Lachnospiraceae bacterium]
MCQTYSNFELILVDDGSKDNSRKICDSYANAYSNVITIHKENGGVLKD